MSRGRGDPQSLEMKDDMKVWPGRPSLPGAMWAGEGVDSAQSSENAALVERCLVMDRTLHRNPGGFG